MEDENKELAKAGAGAVTGLGAGAVIGGIPGAVVGLLVGVGISLFGSKKNK